MTTIDNRQIVIRKSHLSLWLRWAKNYKVPVCQAVFKVPVCQAVFTWKHLQSSNQFTWFHVESFRDVSPDSDPVAEVTLVELIIYTHSLLKVHKWRSFNTKHFDGIWGIWKRTTCFFNNKMTLRSNHDLEQIYRLNLHYQIHYTKNN